MFYELNWVCDRLIESLLNPKPEKEKILSSSITIAHKTNGRIRLKIPRPYKLLKTQNLILCLTNLTIQSLTKTNLTIR
ncbi:hypothetical protein IQ264_09145 [Phormidium sp. LEGE 05292]|uniref:hypothetical protein n=1 Tax=[Phormidium] sp. LEGE 05292 TaxID=767427 RepID=UPI00187F899C|nr:hypothetical protein [Phormidium sp. LEGE 05292]MBE9225585.1 hypothetical protein [Phormidium sp. LEGE 05292]